MARSLITVDGQLELPIDGRWSQRWRHRRHSWLPRSAGGFDADRYVVEPIAEAVAKRFVVAHHYSASYPAAVRRFGLFEAGELVGAAVFAVSMNQATLSNVFPGLAPVVEALELSRFILLDPVPSNAESFFLARCFHQLAEHGLRGVVAFADPVVRQAADGTIICPGHVGTIYQATAGALYLGRSTPRHVIVLPDGTTLAARSAQKVRRQERGHDHVERRLIALGAPVPRAFSDPARWLREALDAIGATRLRHGGCHRYAFALGRTRAERRQVEIAGTRGRYPKRDGR